MGEPCDHILGNALSWALQNEYRVRREEQAREHREKYEALAQWLGIEALKALVPFSPELIRAALAAGDEHLNTLPLSTWDAQHGYHPDDKDTWKTRGRWPTKRPCPCCGQLTDKIPTGDRTAGVWGLVRAAAKRAPQPGTVNAGLLKPRAVWSLSDTVCVLKHVARYHIAPEEVKTDS